MLRATSFLFPFSFSSFLRLFSFARQKHRKWGAKALLLRCKMRLIADQKHWDFRTIAMGCCSKRYEGDNGGEWVGATRGRCARWKESDPSAFLSFFKKVENCFFVSRESAFNVEIWLFLKSRTDSFQTKNRFFQIKKISSSPSFLDRKKAQQEAFSLSNPPFPFKK